MMMDDMGNNNEDNMNGGQNDDNEARSYSLSQ